MIVNGQKNESTTIKNLYAHQGASFRYIDRMIDENGDSIDLRYFEFSGQIRRTYESSTAYSFEIGTIDDGEDGQILVTLADTTTSSMPSGRYVYDILANDVFNGVSYKILSGIFELIPSVTKE